MSITLAHPWLVVLLPLALLPLFTTSGDTAGFSWTELVPRDAMSSAWRWAMRLLGATAIAATAAGLAGPYRPEVQVERVGRGAEVLLLLDRSRSMDQPFGSDAAQPAFSTTAHEPKGRVARAILSDFAAKRTDDLFGMAVFSTHPIPILAFTQRQEMIQAAIAASEVGRGLADTDIGRALLAGTSYFAQRPYSGSRVILLVSDGGAQLDPDTRTRIANAMKRERVALYWIYIRSFRSPGLSGGSTATDEEAVPERSLHAFFESMVTAYRAYEAENPDALRRAVDDISRLEQLPIYYSELLPRQDLSERCYALALLAALGLAVTGMLELRRWR